MKAQQPGELGNTPGSNQIDLNLASDNASAVAPRVMAAIIAANQGSVVGYGDDVYTDAAEAAIQALFETDCMAFPVATGTGANALALAAACPPYGIIYCHRGAHIYNTETGAPELFTNAAKLWPIAGDHGRMTPEALAAEIDGSGQGNIHKMQAAVVSITQATEAGTLYSLEQIQELSKIAHDRGLKVHMDGARFANAAAALDCSPAAMTWQAGVDILSFGCTKNGTMSAEAVVFFDRDLGQDFGFLRKRGGQLFSKMRYVSAQLTGYIGTDDTGANWRSDAAHANAAARRLADGLLTIPGASPVQKTEINIVFFNLPTQVVDGMTADGITLSRRGSGSDDGGPESTTQVRLVTSFNTSDASIDRILEIAHSHA
jgi:threonine aldolase